MGIAKELLPCPFCGGDGKMIHPMGHWTPEGYTPDGSRITCTASGSVCCAMTPAFYGADQDAEAVSAWNRRSPSALASIEMREEMVKALRAIVGDWDERNHGDIEQYRSYGGENYWSPSAAMVSSKYIAAARALLTRIGEGT